MEDNQSVGARLFGAFRRSRVDSPLRGTETRAQLKKRNIFAGGGYRGAKARLSPILEGEWVPGRDPCHWTEVPKSTRLKHYFLRSLTILQFAAGVTYLQYRFRETIGTITQNPYLVAYQIYFAVLEVFGVAQSFFHFMESWLTIKRNSISLRNIPQELLVTHNDFGLPSRSKNVKPRHAQYPSVGVFVPCYNEDVGLVRKTIQGVVNLDYPKELLHIYLCDDGQDQSKRSMVEEMRMENPGYALHWVTRDSKEHAKAGNLNHAIEKTETTLVMSLDADFVPRRNFLQRLVPYFYNLNAASGKYEFNEDLAAVQTPQHFRNLSPYDSDPLDQRATFVFDYIMPSKDFFNATPIVGTNNLLNRRILGEVGFYPCVSITEDTALSIAFHTRGMRTYYVRESLATGQATDSMWSNLRQRARWLMGDFQLFFSWRSGPFAPGLKPWQRIFYIQMACNRLMSIQHILLEIGIICFLLFSISPLDAPDPVKFTIYFLVHVGVQVARSTLMVWSSQGIAKSESGSSIFANIFEYHTLKGVLVAIFKRNIKFAVTDKKAAVQEPKKTARVGVEEDSESDLDLSAIFRSTKNAPDFENDDQEWTIYMDDKLAADGDTSILKVPSKPEATEATKRENRKEVLHNLSYVWYNAAMFCFFLVAILYSFIVQPEVRGYRNRVTIGRRTYRVQNRSALPFALAIGFALMEMIPHGFAVFVAIYFVPYLKQSRGLETDLDHGRCDQYAVHPRTGKLFVPWSFTGLYPIVRGMILIGAFVAQFVFVWGPYQTSLLVPITRPRLL